MRVYIGLTGFSGSGKGTVASMLASFAADHDVHVLRYSLSEEIREILADFESA
jgi:dephospho-CoA kinase